MSAATTSPSTPSNDFTVAEFSQKMKSEGWTFWRGVAIGFCAAFPLAFMAFGGDNIFFSLF